MFNNQKGFTLIELMVVVVIIGILAAIALPNFLAMQDRAKEAEVKSNAHTVQLAVEDFKTRQNGAKPVSGEFVNANVGTASSCNIPTNLKKPFAAAGTVLGTAVINIGVATTARTGTVATTTSANAACTGNLGYDQGAQINPYFLIGWGKSGNGIIDLTEGQ